MWRPSQSPPTSLWSLPLSSRAAGPSRRIVGARRGSRVARGERFGRCGGSYLFLWDGVHGGCLRGVSWWGGPRVKPAGAASLHDRTRARAHGHPPCPQTVSRTANGHTAADVRRTVHAHQLTARRVPHRCLQRVAYPTPRTSHSCEAPQGKCHDQPTMPLTVRKAVQNRHASFPPPPRTCASCHARRCASPSAACHASMCEGSSWYQLVPRIGVRSFAGRLPLCV